MATLREQVSGAILWGSCLYSAATAVWAGVPVERWLPSELAYPVAGQGCELASVLVASSRDAEVASTVMPIVMASDDAEGSENAVAAESCDRIVELLRRDSPWMYAIPRRFICARARKWAREKYEIAHQTLGGEIWIIAGKAIGARDQHAAVKALGLEFRRRGVGYELVPTGRPRSP